VPADWTPMMAPYDPQQTCVPARITDAAGNNVILLDANALACAASDLALD
jgi:hypothetical protein